MKNIFIILISIISLDAFSAVTCKDMQNEETEFIPLRSKNILTKENWNSFDVILGLEYENCIETMRQSLYKIKGEFFWIFRTSADDCDGGNIAGVVYSYDLKTPIAHISDGDIMCKEMWQASERYVNNRCNKEAEKYVMKKMKKFGFNFVDLSSDLTYRKHYAYSFINVQGKIKNKRNKSASVKVLVNLDNCKFLSAEISRLEL